MKQFKFHCPSCGQRFAATYEKAGTASRCSTCREDMMVPMAPSWLKLGFAKQVIPALLAESPTILIRAAHTTEGLNALKGAWDEFAQDECDSADYMPPDEVTVTSNPEQGSLVITITLPRAYRESESYCAVAILSPPEGTKLTNDTLRSATKRYFLLSLYSGKTNYEEYINGKIQSYGKGSPANEINEFVNWARKKCGIEPARPDPGTTEGVSSDEMAIAAAFAEARTTLNSALQRFLQGEYETFSVKFPVTEGDRQEHLWLGDLKYYTDGTFSGIIEDKPKIIESFVQGQSCEVAYDDITDWQSFHQGKIHGNYSLRALIPELSSEEAAKYKAVLADLPGHESPSGHSNHSAPQAPTEAPFAENSAPSPVPAPAPAPDPIPALAPQPQPQPQPAPPVQPQTPQTQQTPQPQTAPPAQAHPDAAGRNVTPARPKLIIPPSVGKPTHPPS